MKFSSKKIVLLLVVLQITAWCNLAYTQVSYDTTTVIVDEAPQTDSVIDVVESDNENVVGQFKNIDSAAIDPITNARKNLQDTIGSLKKQDEYWYADGVELVKPVKTNNDSSFWYWLAKFFQSSTVRIIIWIVVIGTLVALIIYLLISNGIGLFSPNSKKLKIEEEEESISENIFEIDFEKSIAQSIANVNYKLATRLLFLRLLKTMAEKEVIDYSPDKTNFDYLMALNGTKSFKEFTNAVKNYEYVWYGNFELNIHQFEAIKANFDTLQQQLTN